MSNERYADTKMATYYYVLIDISKSMPEEHFEAVKKAIATFEEKLREEDKMVLFTCGDEVKEVYSTGAENQLVDVIGNLARTDNQTSLYPAIMKMLERAKQVTPEMSTRRIGLVFTDGLDESEKGSNTKEEVLGELNEESIPIYAFGCGEQDALNELGKFSRISGGFYEKISPDNAESTLLERQNEILETGVLKFETENNVAVQENLMLTVEFQDAQGILKDTRNVYCNRSIADGEIPGATVSQIGDNRLEVQFSEPVQGAEKKGNYTVLFNGKPVLVEEASYSEQDGFKAVLVFQDTFVEGSYEFSMTNITDCSQEKNEVSSESQVLELTGTARWKAAIIGFLKQFWWTILLAVVLLFAILFLLIERKRAKHVKETTRLLKELERKNVSINQTRTDSGEKIPDTAKKAVQLLVFSGTSEEKRIPFTIIRTAFFGRGNENDISIREADISRQHFVLAVENGEVFIKDLDSKNGTLVNGIRIREQRKLHSGDEIKTGRFQMKIYW